jgi:hypothetical protein
MLDLTSLANWAQILSLILAFVALLITVLQWRSSKNERLLTYRLGPAIPLVLSKESVKKSIKVG